MSQRESLAFGTDLRSDTAALHGLVAAMIAAVPEVRVLRDPTRGGLATTLNEIAAQSGVGMVIDEAAMPVQRQVEAACEFLGLDPLYVANEGKLVAIVPADRAERAAAGDARASAGPAGGADRRGDRGSAPLRADAHPLRRQAHRRLAGRRPAAAHLLNAPEFRAHPVPDPQLQRPGAAPVPGADRARPRGVGRVRHLRRGDRRGRGRCSGRH